MVNSSRAIKVFIKSTLDKIKEMNRRRTENGSWKLDNSESTQTTGIRVQSQQVVRV